MSSALALDACLLGSTFVVGVTIAATHGTGVLWIVAMGVCIAAAIACGFIVKHADPDCDEQKLVCLVVIIVLTVCTTTMTVKDCSGVLGDDTPTEESLFNMYHEYWICKNDSRGVYGPDSSLDNVETEDGGSRPKYHGLQPIYHLSRSMRMMIVVDGSLRRMSYY